MSKKRVFSYLQKRYNYQAQFHSVEKIVLPSSRASVNVVLIDAKEAFKLLLTDPRIKANDYIFGGNDPFAPPKSSQIIGDLHTADAYIKTYKRLIKRPGEQILLPCPLYIDGASTAQFSDHHITAVKVTFGLFTRKARDQPHFWKILGYIPPIAKEKSRGKRILIESKHLEAARATLDAQELEGETDNQAAPPSQDLHTMLAKVLESFVKIQNQGGFKWDLFYNGKVHKGVEFVPFVPFIKCDTDEADKLTGSYTFRGKYVAQLCRYCQCPTLRSDDFMADYPKKNKHQIQKMVNQGRVDELKAMSQQHIQNATYQLQFGCHNNQGVHGATPLEMLHALLLGTFKNLRDEFFRRLKKDSKLADEFDSLAKVMGKFMTRQSARDKPKTQFSNGLRTAKLMAKEYTGILLCMLVAMSCASGRKILGQKKREFGPTFVDDWVLVIETLLQWEEWMKSETMNRKHVKAAKDKHRYIMYLIRKVAKRSKGMGLKTTKFHAILHIADDILNFGVPMEVDTGSNESGHKRVIANAKLTQKNHSNFEEQTEQRLTEIELLELAQQELEGRPLWEYFDGYVHQAQPVPKPEPNVTGGATYRVYMGEDGDCQVQSIRKSEGNSQELVMEDTLLRFIIGLQIAVKDHYKEVPLMTYHKRSGQIFRAAAHYRGEVWRDWVNINWVGHGVIPSKIWGFVDLSELPPNCNVSYGGLNQITTGIYAIVESTNTVDGDYSELISKIATEGIVEGELQFYLADVEAFEEPAFVVPDIGGPENGYLCIRPRSGWARLFETWLEQPDDLDELTQCSYESSEDDIDESDDSSSEGSEGVKSESIASDEDDSGNNSEESSENDDH